jgi:hypothetical protein
LAEEGWSLEDSGEDMDVYVGGRKMEPGGGDDEYDDEPGFIMAPYVPFHLPPTREVVPGLASCTITEARPMDLLDRYDADRINHDLYDTIEIIYRGEGDPHMRVLHGMNIKAKKDEVLAKLRENLELHKKIVAEAKAGYIKAAQEALMARVGELKEGKVVGLGFDLRVPQDHSSVYNTAITMLQMHQEHEVEMTPDQVRHLILDEWEWKQDFIGSNALYSASAREMAEGY